MDFCPFYMLSFLPPFPWGSLKPAPKLPSLVCLLPYPTGPDFNELFYNIHPLTHPSIHKIHHLSIDSSSPLLSSSEHLAFFIFSDNDDPQTAVPTFNDSVVVACIYRLLLPLAQMRTWYLPPPRARVVTCSCMLACKYRRRSSQQWLYIFLL